MSPTAWTPPADPKIYHIIHVERLASVVSDGVLWCDAKMSQRSDAGPVIGLDRIKARRRLLPVPCHPNTCVADYVPFYFCSRSIMLFVIHKKNDAELVYRGGQDAIIHLEADLARTVAWANEAGRRWAFSLSNAGARYTEFRCDLEYLPEVNWPSVAAKDFRSPEVKEGKQAEFLMHDSFPWHLVERIGVPSRATAQQVSQALGQCAHRPPVRILPGWYY